ncbi:inorganic phosphate transporter [Paracoccus caeni]|uniref:Phosphate transporter n=1 Tax=Paracoccus caeni TaxID=657651 RepID=A0A934SBX1_9RHOB|nr:inorganic phosphate transporter [Paracoccus caeni]MBK4214449.1 inorganic phosphate transporter [Paracoccus caeni]
MTSRNYRTLDKDLGRITHTETAQAHAFRPVRWIGLAILMATAVLIVAIGWTGHHPNMAALAVGLVVAGWLGISIGANDVANALGPAVGAGAIRLMPGLLMVGAAQIAGATLAGSEVTHRLASGILDPTTLQAGASAQLVMLSALLSAAIWITFATGARLPVSTTHSIVGGIAGAGVAALGVSGINWGALSLIAFAWVLTPFVSGLLAGAILIFLRRRVLEAPDRNGAALFWLPLMVGTMGGAFAAYVIVLLPYLPTALALPMGLGLGIAIRWHTARRLQRDLKADRGRLSGRKIFGPALVMSAALMGFAHGASDVSNVAGPFSVILSGVNAIDVGTISVGVLMAGGFAIAVGTVLFGRRLVEMVGGGITRLNSGRAFCVMLATAGTVLAAAAFGLPVSSTHVAIGGIFGVGFTREWLDRRRALSRAALPADEARRRILIRRSHVITITAAWLVTVPITASIGAVTCLITFAVLGV